MYDSRLDSVCLDCRNFEKCKSKAEGKVFCNDLKQGHLFQS